MTRKVLTALSAVIFLIIGIPVAYPTLAWQDTNPLEMHLGTLTFHSRMAVASFLPPCGGMRGNNADLWNAAVTSSQASSSLESGKRLQQPL